MNAIIISNPLTGVRDSYTISPSYCIFKNLAAITAFCAEPVLTSEMFSGTQSLREHAKVED